MNLPGAKIALATVAVVVHRFEAVAYDEPTEGPTLTRIHVEEGFSGDIEGAGVAELLQVANADGSATFVGIERVTGAVAGRAGTFLLQIAGTAFHNIVNGEWFVLPGSGTGRLVGLRGRGGFRADKGQSARGHLDYWFN